MVPENFIQISINKISNFQSHIKTQFNILDFLRYILYPFYLAYMLHKKVMD